MFAPGPGLYLLFRCGYTAAACKLQILCVSSVFLAQISFCIIYFSQMT